MSFGSNMDYISSLDSLAQIVEKKTIDTICLQLNELIGKDIIKLVVGNGVFVQSPNSATVEYRNLVHFEPKEKEYIQQLEFQNNKLVGENKSLKLLINEMCSVVADKQPK